MNQIYNNFSVKTLQFQNINDINNYRRMTRTSQANFLADLLFNYIKIIDKHNVIYYNTNTKLWITITEIQYVNLITSIFNETILSIVLIKRNADDLAEDVNKELIKLCGLFDNMTYIKDIIERLFSNLYDRDFITKLDDSKDHFPIKNGLKINFKTLELTERTINDYFSYESPVEYIDGPTPHADRFFSEIMPNPIAREYLRKVLGYTLTGETFIRVFFIWYGKGSNGKTLKCRFMEKILCKQYHQCDQSIFIKTGKGSKGQATPELMALLNKRMSVYSEGESSDKIEMNSAGLKQISGEDSLCGRELYGNQISFTPYTKLHMLTNFTPPLNAEFAIKQRLRYIFLDSEFVDNPDKNNKNQFKKDKTFTDELETIYLSEIFTWIAKGAYEVYQTMSIDMPEDFQIRTDAMLNNEDSIKTFTDRKISITNNKNDIIKKNDIFESYKTFCNNNSQRCQPRSSLFNRLEHLKITTSILHGYDVFRGIRLVKLEENELDNGIFDDEDETKVNYELLYKNSKKEIEELQNKIKLLESQQKKECPLIKSKNCCCEKSYQSNKSIMNYFIFNLLI